MTNKTTKSALLTSSISLLLCFAMLLGTTFAWFTDSVTSANNIIKSGNLDVEFEYWDGSTWKTVKGASDILTNTLWEPGVTQVAYLRVANKGSLALKYQLGVNIVSEKEGTNVAGNTFKLSDSLMFGVAEGVTENTYGDNDTGRAAAIAAIAADEKKINVGYSKEFDMESGDPEEYFALVVYMPTTVGNEANYKTSDDPSNPDKYRPQIDLGINVFATQMENEEDYFNNQYDKDAEFLPVNESASIVNNNGTLGEAVVMTADLPYGTIKVTVPAGAQLSSTDVASLNLTVKNAASNYGGQLTANQVATGYEIYVGGIADYINPFVNGSSKLYNLKKITVELPIGKGRNDVKAYQDNTPLNGTYDDTGVVTFSTQYFTPFSQAKKSTINVVYTKLSEAEKQLNEDLENITSGDSVTINSTTDNMVSINNIADALNGTSNIELAGKGADSTTVAANNATITAEGLTVKDMTIQATGTTTIKGDNATIADVDYQHAGGSYGLTVSGSNATVKDTTISGVASQALVTLNAAADTTATISGTTIKDTSTWGNGNGVTVKTLNGTVDIDDSDISVGGWALQLGNTSSIVKGTVDIANTNINATGLTVRNVVTANFTEVTFANTWSSAALSFEIGGTTNTFTGCDFQTAVNFMRCGTVNRALTFNFNNCTYNGTAITAENIATYFNFSGVAAVNTITVYVNGTAVTL